MEYKKAQAQIITTVLLILIAIGAITVLSFFIFNLVSERLGGTECFDTLGQFEIKAGDQGRTCYETNATGVTNVSVTIERGPNKKFNLTGMSVSVGNEQESKSYKVPAGELPGPNEKSTILVIVGGDLETATFVRIIPLVGKAERACKEGSSEVPLSLCA